MPLREHISNLYGRRTYEQTCELKGLKCKLAKISNQIVFLKRCRDRSIIPKGLRLKNRNNNERTTKILREAERKLVISGLNVLKRDKATAIHRKNVDEKQLVIKLSRDDFAVITRVTDVSGSREFTKSKHSLKEKFSRLICASEGQGRDNVRDTVPMNTVENISGKQLSKHELAVLEKGLSFAPSPKSLPVKEIICAVEAALVKDKNDPREANRTRAKVANLLEKAKRKPMQDNMPTEERSALSSLARRKDICILPSDKGNKVVVMSRKDYHTKTQALLEDDAYIKLQSDPTTKKEKMVKNILKDMMETGNM